MQLTALILSGGRGSRLGGRDKGLITYQNQLLVEKALEMIRPRCRQIIISANRNLEQFRQYGFPVVTDIEPGFRGPLMGIYSAMTYLLESGTVDATNHGLLTLPCDMPNIPDQILDQLHDQSRDQRHAIITKDARGEQYLLGTLPLHLRDNLKAYLNQGNNKVADWILSLNPQVIRAQPQTLCFHNINREEDLDSN